MLQLAAVASYSPCEPRPRVSGAFHLMARRDKVIKIKAKVYKPESFALVDPPEVMRLEPCLVGEPLAARPRGEARVLLRNTTPRRRVFVIEGRCAESRKCGCGISPGGGSLFWFPVAFLRDWFNTRYLVLGFEGEARRVNAVLDAFQGASLTNDHKSCVVEVVESSPSSGLNPKPHGT